MKTMIASLHLELKKWSANPKDWMLLVSGLVFLIFSAIFFLDRSMGYGLSLGLWGFLARFGIFTFALIYSALMFGLIFYFFPTPSVRNSLIYAVLVLISTSALDIALIGEAENRWQFGEYIVTKKIEYHCLTKFNDRECVYNIHLCPKCALNVDKWKRDIITQRLRSVSRTLASTSQPHH